MPQSDFLPEDYVAERAQRRTGLLSLTLFCVVMAVVVAAFFVTNRQHARVKIAQREINQQYADAAKRIEELKELEHQKMQLLDRAEVAAALVERVPRSILLAELINRMPEAVSLQEFDLKSERQRVRKAPAKTSRVNSIKSKTTGSAKKPTKSEVADQRKVQVPVFLVSVELEGIAPTNQHVAQYLTNLNQCQLLNDVELRFSKEWTVNETQVRLFRIRAIIDAAADARHFSPLKINRNVRDPMKSTVELDGVDWESLEVEMDENVEPSFPTRTGGE